MDDTTATFDHATCLACGCLCDDIRVAVEGGRVVEAANACRIGRPWFLASRPGEGHPPALIEGRPATLDDAIGRVAAILREARSPVVWGLSGTTIEAAGAALAIADRLGATVDLAGSGGVAAGLAAFERVGLVSATLGEVKDRADLVVFWRVDPLTTHPRHFERYSVDPPGRFLPEGRASRFVVVVDDRPTPSGEAADLFVQIDGGREAEALEILRAAVRGVAIDRDRASRASGVAFATLKTLADRMKAARYGAIFAGDSADRRASENLARLVRDLNEGRRFVGLGLGGSGNLAGASAVLGWQAGAPSSVDYGRGYPRYLPGEASLADRLEAGEVDALLIVADAPPALPAGLPTIQIAPGATAPDRSGTVAIDVARPGLEARGTVARVDGVMLPLRPALATDLPTDREVLDRLRLALGDHGSQE